ncbi:class I lanthipeptide [Cytophagaceae bacterium YF14B1]|uniref:Class I lanthipeptide n=1 Tax=Xanthocytophaga flava TaxID=3048013 RepID=A0AAE3UBA9_9BACT|nr:class I lanthipeptide [Xanthocytophaga flavus]MDJ1485597.1 class I lanthipeptide [Xanthocytophaga flavus]
MKKKVKLKDSLSLSKETIAQLNEDQLKQLQGGALDDGSRNCSISCNGQADLQLASCCNDSCN